MATHFRPFLLVAAAVLCAVPASAQRRASTLPATAPKTNADTLRQLTMGVIDGTVTDSMLAPMEGAEIGVLRTPLKITTNARGRFRITDMQTGTYILTLRRFGYSPVASVISVSAGDTLRLSYALQKLGVGKLDTVRITERRVSRNMIEFERRRRLGLGEYLTAAQIDKRGSIDVATLLRGFKSLAVVQDDATGITSVQNRRDQGNMLTATGAGACAVQIIVDNIPMPHEADVELLPRPKEVAGIEVYGGPSGAPSQFGGMDRACGMILIWTKDGTNP
jgi:hypothetical protein